MNKDEFGEFLKRPILFPDAFKDWISDYVATNIPKIPISQVFGFKLHSVKSAGVIGAYESTSSTAYTNLTTVGPTLDNVSNGFYIVLFGADVGIWGGGTLRSMGISVDGAAVNDSDAAEMKAGYGGRVFLADLTSGNHGHTLTAKYKVASGTWSFGDRWLHALRVVTE